MATANGNACSNSTNQSMVKRFDNRTDLFQSIASDIEAGLKQSLKNNDKASLIIPGGTTPAPAFLSLSQSELDWSKVTIAQSDERWVDSNHEQSNQKLTESTLLINNAAKASYVAMKNRASTASKGLAECEQSYRALRLPFSISLLGMGLDGHFASLFPSSKNLEHGMSLENESLCIDIDGTGCSVAGDYPQRMSLTLNAILNSEQIMLLITGDEKLALIEKNRDVNPCLDCPISFLLNQDSTPVVIYWAE